MVICRATGMLMIVFSLMITILVFMNRHIAKTGGRDLSSLWMLAVLFFVLGIGVFVRYKPAIVLFMILSSTCALWMSIGSLIEVPFGFALLNILYAAVMISPSIYFYMNWSSLFDPVALERKNQKQPS